MDEDKKKRPEEETAELAEEIVATEAAEAEAASAIAAIIELAGTHTTATETELETSEAKCMSSKSDMGLESRKHVSFKDNRTMMDKTEKLEKVKDFVKEIESNKKKEEAQTVDKAQQLAKKRKMDGNKRQEQSEETTEKESAKRKRSDIEDFNLDDIIIEDLPETHELESDSSDSEEQVSQTIESKEQQQSGEDDLIISENQEIAERFKQIMEMFDNFTKNLESLEMSSMSEENATGKELSPKPTVLDMDVGDGMARDKDRPEETSVKSDRNNDYIIDIEDLLRPETEQFELSQLQQSNISELPKWRQGLQRTPLLSASVRSCKDIATSTQLESRSATIATVSCQTSMYNQAQQLYGIGNSSDGASGPEPSTHNPALSVVMPPRNYDKKNSDTLHHLDNECRVETYMAVPNAAATQQLGLSVGTSISRQNLVKVTESPSVLELPVLSQPYDAERTFHTIHIDTTSSPSSSVMRRPPLSVRCWHVLTDMFNAICMCLQVNKDCIFCIGFFIAFVVSASFLTAFFYRTLSMTPQFFHPTPASTLQLTGTAFRDAGFYYY